MSNSLKIGELTKQTGCLVETIRFYEREGLLLEPARSEGNYRLYTDIHVERLQFIRHDRAGVNCKCEAAGFMFTLALKR